MSHRTTLTAQYVFPVGGTPLERGLVTIDDDHIVSVEPHGTRQADVDLGQTAIVPGFVNTHTHLDLSGARGAIAPSRDFVGWLERVMAYRAQATVNVASDVLAGARELIEHGTTTVGDVSGSVAATQALSRCTLRAISFHEWLGLTEIRSAATLDAYNPWREGFPQSATFHPGVSPHSPYSTSRSLYHLAASTGLPIMTHLAESPDESTLLERGSGPFVAFLRRLGAWEPKNLVRSFDEVLKLADRTAPTIFAHATFLLPDAPIPVNGTIAYCPRTTAAFGFDDHPFRAFLAHGVRVALGTDSLASNPDLSTLTEARFLRAQFPELPGATLLRMATLSGAEALGFADVTGSLTAGKSADLAIVSLPDRTAADSHDLLLNGDGPVAATIFRGRTVFAAHGVTTGLPT